MINLAEKYSGNILGRFTKASYFGGNTSGEFDFVGVRTLNVYTPVPVDVTDYARNGTERFGTLTELQDDVQELTMTQDKGFTVSIDNGNNNDQMLVKKAGTIMDMQLKEKMVPFTDIYCLKKYITNAGIIAPVAEPTKANIVGIVLDSLAEMDNQLVPDENRTIYLKVSAYNLLRQATEFIAIESLGKAAIGKGHVGYIGNAKVVKMPDRYFPQNAHFLITHKDSVIKPEKIKMSRILKNQRGIDGAVLEHRNYFDAFVLGARAGGVFAAVVAASVAAEPTFTKSGNSYTVASTTSGATITYTTDGSDPRYSKTAKVYGSGITPQSGETIKAYAHKEGMYNSSVKAHQ